METKTLSNENYIDIIYKNRNQAYGGYELRKNYASRLKKAGALTMGAVIAITSFSFVTLNHKKNPNTMNTKVIEMTIIPMVKTPPVPITPVTPPPPRQSAGQTAKFTEPKITLKVEDPNELLPDVHNLNEKLPGLTNNSVDSTGGMSSTSTSGNGKPTEKTSIVAELSNKPITFCEQMPQFNGDLNAYLATHLVYPEEARNAGIEGRVAIRFVVNEDGSISDLSIQKGIGYGCDEIALKVIAGMPKWKAGKSNGKPVKVWYTQPISFSLQ